jgi:hypothetical protein
MAMAARKQPPTVVSLPTAGELTTFVHRELCGMDHLDPSQAPLRSTPIKRNGRVCGAVYHVEGPRLLRTSAVWAADESRLLIYDSTGHRTREVTVADAPDATGARAA